MWKLHKTRDEVDRLREIVLGLIQDARAKQLRLDYLERRVSELEALVRELRNAPEDGSRG